MKVIAERVDVAGAELLAHDASLFDPYPMPEALELGRRVVDGLALENADLPLVRAAVICHRGRSIARPFRDTFANWPGPPA